MKAMTYYGKNDIRFEDRPIPTIIEPTDAIIRMEKTTICGTDLGIWKGKNPEIEETARKETGEWTGRILGHEGIGIVEEVAQASKTLKKAIALSCRVLAVVVHVKTAKNNCIHTANKVAVGLWVI